MRRPVKTLAGAGAAAAAFMWTATPAVAQEVIDDGHVDIEIEVDCASGDVELGVHVEDGGHLDPEDVQLVVSAAAWGQAGSAEQAVFGGSDVAVLPESPVEGIVFPGFGLEVDGDCVDSADVSMVLAEVPSGARAAGYNATGSNVFLDSDNPSASMTVTGHGHPRWGFTDAGEYTLYLQATTAVGSSDAEPFSFVIES